MLKLLILSTGAFTILFIGMGIKLFFQSKYKHVCSCNFDPDNKKSSSCCSTNSKSKTTRVELKNFTTK